MNEGADLRRDGQVRSGGRGAEGLLDATAHPDGKYSEQEKRNRAYFLNRLGDHLPRAEQDGRGGGGVQADGRPGRRHLRASDGYQGEMEAYRDAHQWKDVTAAAAEAAKALPKDHAMQMVYAQQLADMGQVDQGLALAKAQVTGSADDLEVRKALRRDLHSPEEIQGGERAAARRPTRWPPSRTRSWTCMYLRGEFYDRQKMYDQAEAEFRKALAIDPQNPAVLNYLGYMLADHGQKLPEALKMISKAVELEPQNCAYLDSLGWVYFKTGQYPQAEENLRKAIERTNTDPAVHRPSGRGVREDGQPEDGGGAVGAVDDGVCALAAGGCRSGGRAEGAAQAGEAPG